MLMYKKRIHQQSARKEMRIRYVIYKQIPCLRLTLVKQNVNGVSHI